jgi:hypothetical protein
VVRVGLLSQTETEVLYMLIILICHISTDRHMDGQTERRKRRTDMVKLNGDFLLQRRA